MPRLLASRGFPALLVISIVLGAAVGTVQVAVPTIAGRWHEGNLAGPLLAAFALGSVVGALWFGARHFHGGVFDRYLVASLALGVLIAPIGFAANPWTLALLLLLAGLAFGPATVSLFEVLDVLAPGGGAEALTWVTSAEAGGSAIGSALAGVLAADGKAWIPCVFSSLLLILAAGAGLLLRKTSFRSSAQRSTSRGAPAGTDRPAG